MPYKDPKKRAEHAQTYGADYYRRNRERTLARTRINKQKKRREWKAFKASQSCSICGMQHEAVIEFHHPNGADAYDKKVHNYVQRGQWKKAYEEVERCVPLCCNCHRILHYNERLGEDDAD